MIIVGIDEIITRLGVVDTIVEFAQQNFVFQTGHTLRFQFCNK